MNKTHETKSINHTEDMALNKHNMHKSRLNETMMQEAKSSSHQKSNI